MQCGCETTLFSARAVAWCHFRIHWLRGTSKPKGTFYTHVYTANPSFVDGARRSAKWSHVLLLYFRQWNFYTVVYVLLQTMLVTALRTSARQCWRYEWKDPEWGFRKQGSFPIVSSACPGRRWREPSRRPGKPKAQYYFISTLQCNLTVVDVTVTGTDGLRLEAKITNVLRNIYMAT